MKRSQCRHCGTGYWPGSGPEGFCCKGCREVHRLIVQDGLEAYYRLQDQTGQPVDVTASEAPDFSALKKAQADGEGEGTLGSARFHVSGMSCMGCVWLLERIAEGWAGCRSAQVSLGERVLTLCWVKKDFDINALAGELKRFGYRLSAQSGKRLTISGLFWRVALSAVLAVNAFGLESLLQAGAVPPSLRGLFGMLGLSVLALSLFACSGYFILPALKALRMRAAHHDVFSATAIGLILLTLLAGFFDESKDPANESLLPVTLFLMLLGRWLQSRLWRQCQQRFYGDGAVCEFSLKRWRFWLSVQFFSTLLVLLGAISAGVTAGGVAGVLQTAAGVFLAPAFYPISVIARYEWPGSLMLAGFCTANLGIILSLIFAWPVWLCALWMVLSGLVWQLLFMASGKSAKAIN